MAYFRIHYTNTRWAYDGCADAEAATQEDAVSKFWNSRSDENPDDLDIWRVEKIHKQICPKCGQPMGNLGLVFDECINRACENYLNATPNEG